MSKKTLEECKKLRVNSVWKTCSTPQQRHDFLISVALTFKELCAEDKIQTAKQAALHSVSEALIRDQYEFLQALAKDQHDTPLAAKDRLDALQDTLKEKLAASGKLTLTSHVDQSSFRSKWIEIIKERFPSEANTLNNKTFIKGMSDIHARMQALKAFKEEATVKMEHLNEQLHEKDAELVMRQALNDNAFPKQRDLAIGWFPPPRTLSASDDIQREYSDFSCDDENLSVTVAEQTQRIATLTYNVNALSHELLHVLTFHQSSADKNISIASTIISTLDSSHFDAGQRLRDVKHGHRVTLADRVVLSDLSSLANPISSLTFQAMFRELVAVDPGVKSARIVARHLLMLSPSIKAIKLQE